MRWKSLAIAFLTLWVGVARVEATVVQFDTSLGSFGVKLFDAEAPITVANFLNYAVECSTACTYDNTIVHRSVPGFVIQGGGFRPDRTNVAAGAPIINEFGHSNTRGTIAMAKLGGRPNSATNQWFINLVDNSLNLDVQNGGFTVFGEVDSGMEVVDNIAKLSIVNLSSIHPAWGSVPVLDPTLKMPELAADANLFRIHAIRVVPEPSTMLLLLGGSLIFARRRSR